ncbi:MAG: hypothetical protein LUF34_00330 [Lachnospiraceae bacterium]|nr:hypothetical protein [Lachnospiraceae bacterium]
MKNNLKRLVALVLALTLTAGLFPDSVWATETETDETEAATDATLEAEGTDDVGSLIADALNEAETEQTEEENYITDVTVEESTATVTYYIQESSVTADVVVAICDETSEQLLASGTTEVSSDESSCAVAIDGEIPDTFLVEVYLLEAETHQPLSAVFTSQMYTQEMQEFLAMTTEDFDEEQVLNLDDDNATNFLVFSESTILLYESSGDGTVTDNGDGTYTVTDACAAFLALQAGDTFAYTYTDDTVLIVKVASVTVNGTTVTVTEATDAELEDVFDYVKIESDGSEGDVSLDTTDMDEGLEFLGVDSYDASEYETEDSGTSTASLDTGLLFQENLTSVASLTATNLEGSYKHSISFKAEGKVGTDLSGSFSAAMTLGFAFKVKLYMTTSHQYVSVSADLTFVISGTVKTEGKTEIPLGKIKYMVVAGVNVQMETAIQIKASAELTGKWELAKTTVGFYLDTDEYDGIHSLCSKGEPSAEVYFEGSIFIGIVAKPSVNFVSDKLANTELSSETGAEISMRLDILDTSGDQKHSCTNCYAGTVNGVYSLKAKVALCGNWLKKEKTFKEVSFKICDFYWCVDHDTVEFFTTCPYISYHTVLTVVDQVGEPVEGASVEVILMSGNTESGFHSTTLTTDENGQIECYLPNGDYTTEAVLEGDFGSVSAVRSFKINCLKAKKPLQ